MRSIKRIPKDFSVVLAFDIIANVFGATITVFLIRILSMNQYAEYTKFVSISTFINGVFGTGISLSLVRYLTETVSRGKKRELGLYSACLVSLLLLLLLALAGRSLIAGIYIANSNVVALACCFGFILAMLHINQAFFQSYEQYTLGGIFGNGRYVITSFAILILFFTCREIRLSAVLWVIIASGVIAFVAGAIYIYKGVQISSWFKNSGLLFDMLKSSVWLVIYCALLNFLNQLDVLMLASRLGDVAVAEYGVAYKYYGLCLSLLPTIMTVLRVRSSKKEFVDSALMRKQFSITWIKKIWLFAASFCAVAIILSRWILPFLNGSEYNNAIGIFRVLCIGVGISYTFAANVQMMMSAKKHKLLCLLAAIALGSNYLVNSLLIPIWGATGAAVATVLSQAIINIISSLIIIWQRS